MMDDPEKEAARLQGVIASALAAMDRGEYGQARRILKTGEDKAPISITVVAARDVG